MQFASADTGAVASTTSMTFNEYVCIVAGYAYGVITALAVLMIIVAGVTYATSMGGSGGKDGLGGISTAKEMIVAALTGLLLLGMSSFFVGSCGVPGGGFFQTLFSRYFSRPLVINSSIDTNGSLPGSATNDVGISR